MKATLMLATAMALVLTGVGELLAESKDAPAERGAADASAVVQSQDGVTVKLQGARYHTKRQTLLIRVEYWGEDMDSVNFASPLIRVDGARQSLSAPG